MCIELTACITAKVLYAGIRVRVGSLDSLDLNDGGKPCQKTRETAVPRGGIQQPRTHNCRRRGSNPQPLVCQC